VVLTTQPLLVQRSGERLELYLYPSSGPSGLLRCTFTFTQSDAAVCKEVTEEHSSENVEIDRIDINGRHPVGLHIQTD
jgi:hypothetical protein